MRPRCSPPAKIAPDEATIQRAIVEWLTLHGYGVYRSNTGSGRGGRVKYGLRHCKDKLPGGPDLLVVRFGKCWALEVKAASGKMRPDQVAWRERWSGDYGMPYFVVRSASEALECVEGNQVARNLAGVHDVLAAIGGAEQKGAA